MMVDFSFYEVTKDPQVDEPDIDDLFEHELQDYLQRYVPWPPTD